MTQHDSYLRQFQNSVNELMVAFKQLEALEEKRIDVGLTFEGDSLKDFPHVIPDTLSNAQYAVAELKKFMAIHRVNFNRIIP